MNLSKEIPFQADISRFEFAISPQLDPSRLLMSDSTRSDIDLNIFSIDPKLCEFGNIISRVNGRNTYETFVEVTYKAKNGLNTDRRMQWVKIDTDVAQIIRAYHNGKISALDLADCLAILE